MKIHTIQLNIEDFEAGTVGMDAKEKGAYMSLLICLYKVSTHELPDCDKRLSRMACLDAREWRKVRKVLEPKFIVYDGVWKHKRVLAEAIRYQQLSDKNRLNALKKNKPPKPVGSQSHSQNGANTSNKEQVTNNNSKNPPLVPPKGKRDKGSRLDKDWELPLEWGDWAVEKGYEVSQVLEEEEKFKDYWIARPGQGGVKLDWQATWRNWIRNKQEHAR